MMIEKEDLGLSLSLSFPAAAERNPSSLQMNYMPSLNPSPPLSSSSFNLLHKTTNWPDSYPPLSDRHNPNVFIVDTRSILKGIDVNRIPATATEAEEVGVSSPNSTISSISGKRSERDVVLNENDVERASSRGISDDEDGENSRKKLRLSKDQSAVLEESFKEHNTLNPKQKLALAKRLGLRPRQVEVWFQNRRARTKLKQTEVDCEFLKRCCENLTEENRRLHKEIQELRALKLSPQFYMQMAPPTTLTMCPSCERVGVPAPEKSVNHQHNRSHPTPTNQNENQNQHRTLPFNLWPTSTNQAVYRPASTNQVVHKQISALHPQA